MALGWSEERQRKADQETDEMNALARRLGYGEMLYYMAVGEETDLIEETAVN